jgi:hypothetical protein
MIGPTSYTTPISTGIESRTAGYAPVFNDKNKESFLQTLKESASTTPKPAAENSAAPEPKSTESESNGFGFFDFIKAVVDVINPLQHIPVISTLYRDITGDEIHPIARIAGDGLFGGPLGAMAGMADVALKDSTGKDAGETVMALLHGEKDPEIQIASAIGKYNDAARFINS